jgi:hypothetical protein
MINILVGIGRSGTSLLQSIIYHQDDILVYPETQFFRRFLIANDTTKKEITKEEFKKILCNKNPRYNNLRDFINISKLDMGKYSFNEIIDLISQEDTSILLKDARDLDYLKKISFHVSDLRVICTIRDLRDVVLSRMNAAFSRRWGVFLNLAIMRFQYTSLIKYEKQHRVFLVRYEDFTHGDFTSLEDLNIMNKGLEDINLNEIAEVLFSKEELQKHKKKNKKTVDGANFNKWEGVLPKRTIFVIELMFDDYFKRFGYKRYYKGKGISTANSVVRYLFLMIYFIYYWISIWRDKNFYKI